MTKSNKAPSAPERKVVVNGESYIVGDPVSGRVKAGMLVRETRNRNAWRVICLDGDEIILRSMRSANIFEAVSDGDFRKYYRKLTRDE